MHFWAFTNIMALMPLQPLQNVNEKCADNILYFSFILFN